MDLDQTILDFPFYLFDPVSTLDRRPLTQEEKELVKRTAESLKELILKYPIEIIYNETINKRTIKN